MTVERGTYDAEDIARLLGISVRSVYRAAHNGEIPHIQLGKRLVFPCHAVDAWLRTSNGMVEAETSERPFRARRVRRQRFVKGGGR